MLLYSLNDAFIVKITLGWLVARNLHYARKYFSALELDNNSSQALTSPRKPCFAACLYNLTSSRFSLRQAKPLELFP